MTTVHCAKLPKFTSSKAIDEQSVIGRPGRIGRRSGKKSQSLEYVLVYKGRYNKPEQYGNIILKANPDGENLYLKDVAKVELGSEFFDIREPEQIQAQRRNHFKYTI